MGYWHSGKDKAIASSELLPRCWVESHFQPFPSVQEIFLKKKWRKRGLLNASFVIYVLFTDGWETILNLRQTTFAILNSVSAGYSGEETSEEWNPQVENEPHRSIQTEFLVWNSELVAELQTRAWWKLLRVFCAEDKKKKSTFPPI